MSDDPAGPDVRIVGLTDIDLHARGAEIDRIFFEASSVRSFRDHDEKDAFRWRWLGRYLCEEPQHAFLALDPSGAVCGYLVGSLDDPAQRPAFDELGYFSVFGALTAQFPAHLHINVAEAWRSRGVGERLVAAFISHAVVHGAPGVHVVTGRGMRNVGFYDRLGFREHGRVRHGAGEVVLLGRRLL